MLAQYLKKLFEISNWNSPAASVAKRWMLRRAHLRASTLNDGDSGEYSFNFDHNELLLGPQLLSAFSTSPLLAAVATQRTDACAVCYLTEIKICSLTLEPQDWVLLREGPNAVIGQIIQMALVRSHGGGTEVYLWCGSCRCASQLLEDEDGMMRIPIPEGGAAQGVLVSLQLVAMSALSCAIRGDHLEFRYVF